MCLEPVVEPAPKSTRVRRLDRQLLKTRFCEMPFTGIAVRDVIGYLESRTFKDPFGYIVTPNVDHIVRNWRDGGKLVEVYDDADLSLVRQPHRRPDRQICVA